MRTEAQLTRAVARGLREAAFYGRGLVRAEKGERTVALKAQLDHARQTGVYDLLEKAAQRHGLPLAYLLAVASRETGIRNILGDGDHGIGVLQIDVRFHDIAARAKATGSWRTSSGLAALIDYGAEMLAGNVAWAKGKWPQYGHDDGHGWLKIAASAYNAGRGGAAVGVRAGDSDRKTTGGDYGRDVLNRMKEFEDLLT